MQVTCFGWNSVPEIYGVADSESEYKIHKLKMVGHNAKKCWTFFLS